MAMTNSTERTMMIALKAMMIGCTIVNTTQFGMTIGALMISDKAPIGNMQLETLTTLMAHLHTMTTTMTTMMTTTTETMTMVVTENCMKMHTLTMVCSQQLLDSNLN